MPNRHGGGFLDLYSALLTDVIEYDPTYAVEAERDYSRIVSNFEHRGLSVFLKDLPEIGKLLEFSLSQERLDPSNLPLMGGYKKGTPIPRLFKGLWLRLFEVNGCLKQNIDPYFITLLEHLYNAGKKFEMEPPPSALYETTKEFYDVDEALPPPTLDWSDGSSSLKYDSDIGLEQLDHRDSDQRDLFRSDDRADAQLLDTIQRVADVVSTSLGEFILPGSSRHGRGAVYEDLRGIEKFSIRAWPSRLSNTFPLEGFLLPVGRIEDVDTGEIPSKLLAVPKTIKGPRLIAKEPTAHMYAQLSIMDWIYSTVPNTFIGKAICFTNQTISGQLALDASRTQSHGTIDLKSASDRVSLWLIERLFRRNHSLLLAMADCRTQYVDLSIDKKLPSLHRLKKFTTQGSALTFPIQSLVFFMISAGAMMNRTGQTVNEKNLRRIAKSVQIFGDDIIVPNEVVDDVIYALEKCFLKVNAQKTHYRGNFRESCGVRAYAGVDVTPTYVTKMITRSSKPADYKSVIDASNNFAKKWLWHTANVLLSNVPKGVLNSIPFSSSQDRSIVLHSFSGSRIPDTAKVRWNPRYQREEAFLFSQKVKKRKLKVDGSLLLDAFLGTKETRPALPDWHGVDDWYPMSRWESRDVVSREWVPL